MAQQRHHPTSPSNRKEKRRSDYLSSKWKMRDLLALSFAADMQYASMEHIGEWLAPEYLPASDEPPPDAPPTEEQERPGRGGPRTGQPWPQDRRKRIQAVRRTATERWRDKFHAIEIYQGPEGLAPWIRVTQEGLRRLGKPWKETPFPTDMTLFLPGSHVDLINRTRLLLARGKAGAPKHHWISERAIEATYPQKAPGVALPHLPDGAIELLEKGAWSIRKKDDTVLMEMEMAAGQRVAIEVEKSRKDFERLEHRVLPSLLEHYDFVWYFCSTQGARQAIYAARRDHLHTEEDRQRIRILDLHEYLPLDTLQRQAYPFLG